MSKQVLFMRLNYAYQITSPEIDLILQADRERKERLQNNYGMKPPKFEQLFKGGNLYKIYSYFYYFILSFDYKGRNLHSKSIPEKKHLFNKELLKLDFCEGYKQGTKYFEDNYLTNREGVYSNTEPIVTQLKYLLNEWKGVNSNTSITELKYPNTDVFLRLSDFVRMEHNQMITSRTILTYGFYSGFYARLVEMVESYSGLLGTIESLEYTTTEPETKKKKPFTNKDLTNAIVKVYGKRVTEGEIKIVDLLEYYSNLLKEQGYSYSISDLQNKYCESNANKPEPNSEAHGFVIAKVFKPKI